MSWAGLRCRQLTFQRPGGKTVLDRIDADFAAGDPVLVTGDTGAGKSSLLHLMGAMLLPTGGEIWAGDQPVSRWSALHRDMWRRQVGMVFQHLHLVPDLSVEENILLPCIPQDLSWIELSRRAGALLARFDLAHSRHEKPHLLSGGQRQRVAWARALIARPRYLLLDEPTAFQDDTNTQGLLDLLVEQGGHGVCLVVSSHDARLRNAAALFARTYRLAQGRLEILP